MIWCRMIAGFGSGAAFSLVSGMTQGNPMMGAFSTGTLFALLQGAFYQVWPICWTEQHMRLVFMLMHSCNHDMTS